MTKEEEIKAKAQLVEMQDKYYLLGYYGAVNNAINYIGKELFRYMPFVDEGVKEKIIKDFKEAMKI